MKNYVNSIVNELKNSSSPESLTKALLGAHDLLAKHNIEGFVSRIAPEVDEMIISNEEAQQIVECLVELLNEKTAGEARDRILWALSEARCPTLRNLFVTELQKGMKELLAHNNCIGQVLAALENIETLPKHKPGRGVAFIAETVDLADAVLEREGIRIPM